MVREPLEVDERTLPYSDNKREACCIYLPQTFTIIYSTYRPPSYPYNGYRKCLEEIKIFIKQFKRIDYIFWFGDFNISKTETTVGINLREPNNTKLQEWRQDLAAQFQTCQLDSIISEDSRKNPPRNHQTCDKSEQMGPRSTRVQEKPQPADGDTAAGSANGGRYGRPTNGSGRFVGTRYKQVQVGIPKSGQSWRRSIR